MAHSVLCCREWRRRRPACRRCRHCRQLAGPQGAAALPGFTLIELLVVIAIASVLMLIGAPALLNVAARYKVHSSAQTLEMLGRQARYESIKLNQPVTLVLDTKRKTFYVFSGTIAGMPPYSFPNGQGDIPPTQRVAVWALPRGVSYAFQPVTDCTAGSYCQSFQFAPDGSGTGDPVTFSTPNQPSYKVSMVAPATGKLAIK
jgi:prepilin-type N-terminal cleavage/methylation domain-containing protein